MVCGLSTTELLSWAASSASKGIIPVMGQKSIGRKRFA